MRTWLCGGGLDLNIEIVINFRANVNFDVKKCF